METVILKWMPLAFLLYFSGQLKVMQSDTQSLWEMGTAEPTSSLWIKLFMVKKRLPSWSASGMFWGHAFACFSGIGRLTNNKIDQLQVYYGKAIRNK